MKALYVYNFSNNKNNTLFVLKTVMIRHGLNNDRQVVVATINSGHIAVCVYIRNYIVHYIIMIVPSAAQVETNTKAKGLLYFIAEDQ